MFKTWLIRIVFLLLSLAVTYAYFRPRPWHFSIADGDKYAHASAFFLLTLVTPLVLRWAALRLWLLMVLVGVVAEFMQGVLLPHRSFSYYDMAANVLGVSLAVGGIMVVRRLCGSAERKPPALPVSHHSSQDKR